MTRDARQEVVPSARKKYVHEVVCPHAHTHVSLFDAADRGSERAYGPLSLSTTFRALPLAAPPHGQSAHQTRCGDCRAHGTCRGLHLTQVNPSTDQFFVCRSLQATLQVIGAENRPRWQTSSAQNRPRWQTSSGKNSDASSPEMGEHGDTTVRSREWSPRKVRRK